MNVSIDNFFSLFNKTKPIAIISDSHVGPLYGRMFKDKFTEYGYEVFLFTFPEGEAYKTRLTKEKLENAMLEKKLGVDTTLVAIGGGVVTDMAGFIAATYCRGIPYICIPTTLLAMCDASVGGKNGVNCEAGKNLIGTIYQPKKTILDFNFLTTLNQKEIKEGLAEIIKMALIAKPALFRYLEKNREAILSLNRKALEYLVDTSIHLKKKIVRESKKNKEKRNLLNFGHTVAHSLELASHYTISHGQAVAFGIWIESKIATQLEFLSEQNLSRIHHLLVDYGYLLDYPEISKEELIEGMALDKKSVKGRARFVILEKIGGCLNCDEEYCRSVEEEIIRACL